jgi:purine-cytosine permease-like protein
MLSGAEMLELAESADVVDLEGHVDALFALRSARLAAAANGLLAGFFAVMVSVVAALLTAPVQPDSRLASALAIVGAVILILAAMSAKKISNLETSLARVKAHLNLLRGALG